MIAMETDEKISNFFKSLFANYQQVLEIKMKGSDFVFDYVGGLTIICLWGEDEVSPLSDVFHFATL